MKGTIAPMIWRVWRAGSSLMFISLLVLLVACARDSATKTAAPASPAPAASASIAPTATAIPIKLLKVSPDTGPVGTTFTITGEGFIPGKLVDFQWLTVTGGYSTKASTENVEFYERMFEKKRNRLGAATVDAKGGVTATFTAPEDFGEPHDIYAVVDGVDFAKGGFRILTTASISPTEGPVGSPINVTLKGMGWSTYVSTLTVRYDNKYMGFVTAITTGGSASFQIRAAGPVGKHHVSINADGVATPYLNWRQSPYAQSLFDKTWVFTVTRDEGAPRATLDWPDPRRVATLNDGALRTTATLTSSSPDLKGAFEPASGPILSPANLRASGLPANAEVELFWVTARGNRVTPSGWSLLDSSLGRATTGRDGSLNTRVQIPDSLGGWHVVKVVQGEKLLMEVPYYVERSLVQVTPQRVKAGEIVTVQIKGIGWTELDNGIAVTYDNAYIGYACGFNSGGDITFDLVATGGPGTHLIDFYPMVYQGHGKPPWTYQIPHLTALQDAPGLALGYRLPVYRLAIEVVE
ncbi:MAG: hypothetical protein HYY04_00020 [Chloroflexi bacterium]|nr:hypothetical protein [Chloroflexota bacterium]